MGILGSRYFWLGIITAIVAVVGMVVRPLGIDPFAFLMLTCAGASIAVVVPLRFPFGLLIAVAWLLLMVLIAPNHHLFRALFLLSCLVAGLLEKRLRRKPAGLQS